MSPGTARILGCANAFPGLPVDNRQLVEQLQKLGSPKISRRAKAIARRLGIQSRHLTRHLDRPISTPVVDAPTLCARAIQSALNHCTSETTSPGFLISHTATPHTLLPSNAAWIAEKLGFEQPFMELRQACTGFANALQIALPMLNMDPDIESVCIVGSETGSVYFDISEAFIDDGQLVNYMQMGDGASALILTSDHNGGQADRGSRRISHCYVGHLGLNQNPGFQLSGAGSGQPVCEWGLPRFEHAAESVREKGPELFLAGLRAVADQGFKTEDFDYILPHQANGRVDQMLGDYLEVDPRKIINDARNWGNLGSAAIWASLTHLINSGRLDAGDRVLVLGAEATKYMYGGFIYEH